MEYNNPEMEKPLPDLGDNKTTPDGREHHGHGYEEMGAIHIPKDMLPKGMAEKIKKGDILEFKCIGPADQDGDIPVEYNTGKDSGESWEDGLRKEMSPRSGEGSS